jgi:AcrR family transcriptional regulator
MAAEARARQQERLDRQARAQAARREHMLNVAQAVIDAQGLDGLNMRVIARRAGYTAGALYAYFNGKQDILLALQRRVLERLEDAVKRVKVVKPGRGGRLVGDAGATVAARQRYVDQSLAWWRQLARDPGGFQLLLLRPSLVSTGASPAETTPLSGPPATLGDLEEVLQPCRDSLLELGLTEQGAYQLHRELVACGLGLLALAAASGHSHPDGLESQWRSTVERWLDMGAGPLPPVAGGSGPAGVRDQASLFPG